jgi:hypothetical protein
MIASELHLEFTNVLGLFYWNFRSLSTGPVHFLVNIFGLDDVSIDLILKITFQLKFGLCTSGFHVGGADFCTLKTEWSTCICCFTEKHRHADELRYWYVRASPIRDC